MKKIPATKFQKNNIFTISESIKISAAAADQKIDFSFEAMGIPKLASFINFKEN